MKRKNTQTGQDELTVYMYFCDVIICLVIWYLLFFAGMAALILWFTFQCAYPLPTVISRS